MKLVILLALGGLLIWGCAQYVDMTGCTVYTVWDKEPLDAFVKLAEKCQNRYNNFPTPTATPTFVPRNYNP